MPDQPPEPPSILDPDDWEAFRKEAHRLLDGCVTHLAQARQHPWRAPDQGLKALLAGGVPEAGTTDSDLVDALLGTMLPHGTGNIHPRFFGWVHGTGLAAGLLAEITAATMNSNCGGRNHGAIHVEETVLEWCRTIFDFPPGSSGILTTGTSQATLLALLAARHRLGGERVKTEGIGVLPPLRVYGAEGVHACIGKALAAMGHGSRSLCPVPVQAETGAMDPEALEATIAADRDRGLMPLAVVATAGSVNTGSFDDINALADLCERQGIWLHVDGAFGAWIRLGAPPYANLADGIGRADSLAFDFHKWMYVQYDCGAVIMRDGDNHRATFEARPDYLAGQTEGLGASGTWYCDYGLDLSRGFRALKVWTAITSHGLAPFRQAITDNCRRAAQMGETVARSACLELAAPVVSNICVFQPIAERFPGLDLNEAVRQTAIALQLSGDAVFSTTVIGGRSVLRAAIVNHRTTGQDVERAVAAAEREMLRLADRGS